jgi:hypothetical protein
MDTFITGGLMTLLLVVAAVACAHYTKRRLRASAGPAVPVPDVSAAIPVPSAAVAPAAGERGIHSE